MYDVQHSRTAPCKLPTNQPHLHLRCRHLPVAGSSRQSLAQHGIQSRVHLERRSRVRVCGAYDAFVQRRHVAWLNGAAMGGQCYHRSVLSA
jgi:hypothetical protein